MKAGRLRHRVALRQPTTTQDATGAETESFATMATVWAEVRTLGTNERQSLELDTDIATVIHRVTIRKPSVSVTARWQVEWNSRTFNVLGVQEPDNRNRMIQLDCVEVIKV